MAAYLLAPEHALSTSAAVENLTQVDFLDHMVGELAPPPGIADACRSLLIAAAWDNKDIPGSVRRFLDAARNPEFVPTIIMLKKLCHDENETWRRAWKTVDILSAREDLSIYDDDEIWGVLWRRDSPPELTIFRNFEEQKMVAGLFEAALS